MDVTVVELATTRVVVVTPLTVVPTLVESVGTPMVAEGSQMEHLVKNAKSTYKPMRRGMAQVCVAQLLLRNGKTPVPMYLVADKRQRKGRTLSQRQPRRSDLEPEGVARAVAVLEDSVPVRAAAVAHLNHIK